MRSGSPRPVAGPRDCATDGPSSCARQLSHRETPLIALLRFLGRTLPRNKTDNQVAVLLVSKASRALHLILDDGADLCFRGRIVIGGLAIELDHDVGRWHGHDIMEMVDIVALEMLLKIGL